MTGRCTAVQAPRPCTCGSESSPLGFSRQRGRWVVPILTKAQCPSQMELALPKKECRMCRGHGHWPAVDMGVLGRGVSRCQVLGFAEWDTLPPCGSLGNCRIPPGPPQEEQSGCSPESIRIPLTSGPHCVGLVPREEPFVPADDVTAVLLPWSGRRLCTAARDAAGWHGTAGPA